MSLCGAQFDWGGERESERARDFIKGLVVSPVLLLLIVRCLQNIFGDYNYYNGLKYPWQQALCGSKQLDNSPQ